MKNDEIVKTDNLIPQDFPFNIARKEYKEANKNIAKNRVEKRLGYFSITIGSIVNK